MPRTPAVPNVPKKTRKKGGKGADATPAPALVVRPPAGPPIPVNRTDALEGPQPSEDLKWVHYTDVAPWADNPNIHPDFQPETIAESIKQFGFVAPAVLWPSANRLVAGHGRLQAMRLIMETGYDYLDPQGELVHVDPDPSYTPLGAPAPGFMRVLFHEFRSESSADAYGLADNEIARQAKWDDTKVATLLKKLASDDDFDGLHALGFDADRLQTIIMEGTDNAAFLSGLGGGAASAATNGGGDPAGPAPTPTPEGNGESNGNARQETLVDFTVPMSVAERAEIHGIVNLAKRNTGVTTTREAVVAIFAAYEKLTAGGAS